MLHAFRLIANDLVRTPFGAQVSAANNEQAFVRLEQLRTYRAVGPSLKAIGKQRLAESDQRISLSLTIEYEFLKLHGGDIACFGQNIFSDIKHAYHISSLFVIGTRLKVDVIISHVSMGLSPGIV